MSLNGDGTPMSVAVAVKGGGGGNGGRGSRRAVRWAVENLMPKADRFVLIHVIPCLTSIPTPSGALIPIKQLDPNVVSMYMEDLKVNYQEIFIPFKKLCKSKTKKVETILLEGDNPATSLVRYISDSRITSLVLGSWSSSCIRRKLKGPGIPKTVLKNAPGTCNVYMISRDQLMLNSVLSMSTCDNSTKHWLVSQRECGASTKSELLSRVYSSSECGVQNSFGKSSTDPNSEVFKQESQKNNCQNMGDIISETQTVQRSASRSSTYSEKSDVQAEVEQLRLELRNVVILYNQACEDLVYAQNKIHVLSSDCLEESKRVNEAIKNEKKFRKIVIEEKEKHLEAVKEVELAKSLLATEAYEKKAAELKGIKESLDKQKIVDALLLSDKRYRRYSREEIEVATDFFSETKVVGIGAYGKVYKCFLDHTPVAIKVLRPDSSDRKDEFLKEVEVLSKLRHPNIVLLLGACPENGCLVYEYMENRSLDDLIFRRSSDQSLPWAIRFRIAFEVACGLAFLHNSKPEPIVHWDIKPGNILLDQNYVSKIGDAGLAKLIADIVPDSITEYRNSILVGTLFYMDPEYQRTGTVRPKSDLYGFGIIILQLLTARHPNGLLLSVENAFQSGLFLDILDKSITDWPLAETMELAQMALKCTRLRCRDRPDLDNEVLPVLKKLADFAEASKRVATNRDAPSHFYCPILQEVMDDPYIAADGFTYEHKAIKIWVERHNVSPVTKRRLQHKMLTRNLTLCSAIQEWRSHLTSSKT